MNINDEVDITAICDELDFRGRYQWIDVPLNNAVLRISKSQNEVYSVRVKTEENGGSLMHTRASLFAEYAGKKFKVVDISPLDKKRQSVIESKDKPTNRRKKNKPS